MTPCAKEYAEVERIYNMTKYAKTAKAIKKNNKNTVTKKDKKK